MKSFCLVALTLALATSSADAANVKFRGYVCIKSASAGCAAQGWEAGDCSYMSLKPAGIGDNGPQTSLSFFYNFGAVNHSLASGSPIGTTFKDVTGAFLFSGAYQTTAKMRFTKQTPADLTTAQDVAVVGDIRDFDDDGCNINFKATGQRVQ